MSKYSYRGERGEDMGIQYTYYSNYADGCTVRNVQYTSNGEAVCTVAGWSKCRPHMKWSAERIVEEFR
jgi:hypothetical protein